jgi:uncharacterized protein
MKMPAFLIRKILPMNTLTFCILVYAVLCLLVFFFHRRLIYFPYSALVSTPSEAGLDYRDVFFDAADGPKIHGWIVEPFPGATGAVVSPRANLLFFHGNGGNLSYSVEALRTFAVMGYRTLAIDYRGYGRSGGSPHEEGLYRDAEAALRFFCDEYGLRADEVVYVGRSLGGGVALELALREKPAALVLESPFASIRDMAGMMGYLFPLRLLLGDRYDNVGKVGGLDCPLLVIHSGEDEVVPFRQGVRVFEAAAEPKEFIEIRGGHDEGYYESGSVYTEGFMQFVAGVE